MAHRIDDPTAVAVKPAPRPPGSPGYFTGGSPSGGTAATIVRYEWANMLQEEIAAVVLAAGLVLSKTDDNQLLKALQTITRQKITADLTLYVSPTGNDSRDGLTSGTALLTGQAAWNKAVTLDLNGHNITIQFADGNYTDPVLCEGAVQGLTSTNGVVFQGNIASPGNVVRNISNGNCFETRQGAALRIRGMTLEATGVFNNGQGCAVYAGRGSTVSVDTVILGPCTGCHLASFGAEVDAFSAPYTISGGAEAHMFAGNGGTIGVQQSAVTVLNAPTFSIAFAWASSCGQIYAPGAGYTGTAHGPHYNAQTNAVISTGSGSGTFFPGDVAGGVQTGGQYA